MNLLPYQFKNSTKLNGFLNAFLQQIEELNSNIEFVKNNKNLDFMGQIVGQERKNLSDEEFLAWIKVKIKLNNSSGIIGDIFSILKILMSHGEERRDVAIHARLLRDARNDETDDFLITEFFNIIEVTIFHDIKYKREIFSIIKSALPVCTKVIFKKAAKTSFRFDIQIGGFAEYE